MKELNTLVEDYFSESIEFSELFRLIEEVEEGNALFERDEKVESDSSGNVLKIAIPKFRISEQWGTPGSDDRKIIEMFTSKIQGATLSDKIGSLNSFVSDCDAGCAAAKDVGEILANLVFLDALASIVYDFNDKTGGFLFESIISALFGGESMQVPTTGGKYQDVTDIYDDQGRPMSLKFLFDRSTYIKGSFNNLVKSIVGNNHPMIYLVGLKNREHETGKVLAIDFYQFTVGTNDESAPSPIPGDFDAKDIGESPGLYVEKIKTNEYHIGTLNFGSRAEIQQIGQNYIDRLGSVLLEIYKQLDDLSNNVNTYFLSSPEKKDSALKARVNATALKRDTEEL